MLRKILPLALLVVTGCASETADPPSEGDRVFSVTPTATPNGGEILGVWESTSPQKAPPLSATTRFELRVDSITIALKCSMDDGSAPPINVGVKADATVSKDGITVKKGIERSERIGANGACIVKFGAGVLPTCEANMAPEKRQTCFAFGDGSLKIYQQAGTAPTDLKKVAD